MKKYFVLILFISIASCVKNTECENQDLGAFKLDSSYFNYVNFDVFDSLIFKSEMGEELVFLGRISGLRTIEREFKTSCGLDSIVNNYTIQNKQFGFTSPDESHEFTILYVWYNSDFDTTESLMFCDIFNVIIFLKSPVENELEKCVFKFLLNCNESDIAIDIDEKELLATVEINDEIYENVYRIISCNQEVLFKQGLGVIKFTDLEGKAWYFDRKI